MHLDGSAPRQVEVLSTAKGRTPAAAAAAALPHGPCPIYTARIDCIAFLIIYSSNII
jgi:hypothetical protein